MPTTANKGYSVPTPGTESGTWGADLNANTFSVIDLNLGGSVVIPVSNVNVALTAVQAQNGIIRISGTLTANVTVTIPTPGIYTIRNETVGAFQVYIAGPIGSAQPLMQGLSSVFHIDATIGAFLAGQRTTTVGMVASFVGQVVPPGWLFCDGSLVSRTLYANLWTYAQTTGNIQTDANWTAGGYYGAFSTGDGVTTFRIPDLRGIFIRSWANTHPSHDPGRVSGTYQAGGVMNHQHPAASAVTDPGHSHPGSKPGISGYNTVGGATNMSNSTLGNTNPSTTGITVNTTISNNTGGLTENRPDNTALMYCVSFA